MNSNDNLSESKSNTAMSHSDQRCDSPATTNVVDNDQSSIRDLNQSSRETPSETATASTTTIQMSETNVNNTDDNDVNLSPAHPHHHRRSRNSSLTNNILNFNRNLLFDPNTFKQIKRLYCGMLLVAIAYSVAMVIMMMVLYKSLPESIYYNYRQQYRLLKPKFERTATTTDSSLIFDNNPLTITTTTAKTVSKSIDSKNDNHLWTIDTTGQSLYRHLNQRHHPFSSSFMSRTQLDQVIAVNFLTSILYIMAFYAAHREFYHLTIAFTTTLVISMIISSLKTLSDGSNFSNNLMSLLLRLSIILTSIIYSTQIRRKQMFISHARAFWLNHPNANSMFNNTTNNNQSSSSSSSSSATVRFLQEIFGSSGTLMAVHPTFRTTPLNIPSLKTENVIIKEYLDQPPDYEEALHCPSPYVRSNTQPITVYPLSSTSSSQSSSSSSSSSNNVAPPSFDQI